MVLRLGRISESRLLSLCESIIRCGTFDMNHEYKKKKKTKTIKLKKKNPICRNRTSDHRMTFGLSCNQLQSHALPSELRSDLFKFCYDKKIILFIFEYEKTRDSRYTPKPTHPNQHTQTNTLHFVFCCVFLGDPSVCEMRCYIDAID